MSTGASLSPAEQARLRRERREQKITSQGGSRLEKIAGLQGGAAAREALYAEHAEPDTASVDKPASSATSSSRLRRRSSSHGADIFGVDGGSEDPFSMLRAGNDPFASVPEELQNDPMLKLLLNTPLFGQGSESGAGAGGIGGGIEDSSSDDLSRLAEKLSKQLMGQISGDKKVEEQPVPNASTWKWKLVRLLSVCAVLGYLWVQLEDYDFSRTMDVTCGIVPLLCLWSDCKPIFYTFVTVSLSLQALRLILDRGRPVSGSIIASIGSFLPHPFGTALVGFARYRMILTDLLEDFSLLLVGLALMYWFKIR